jgi:hypothetical protein
VRTAVAARESMLVSFKTTYLKSKTRSKKIHFFRIKRLNFNSLGPGHSIQIYPISPTKCLSQSTLSTPTINPHVTQTPSTFPTMFNPLLSSPLAWSTAMKAVPQPPTIPKITTSIAISPRLSVVTLPSTLRVKTSLTRTCSLSACSLIRKSRIPT